MSNKRKNQNSTTQKDNTIFGYLKRIITWQSASFAAAIIVPIAIYYCQKVDNTPIRLNEIELLKDSIKNDISIIETSFNPDDIDINDNKTLPHAFKEIKDFQLLSQELITYWYMIEDSPSVLTFKEKKIAEVEGVLNHQLELFDIYVSTMDELVKVMDLIDNEGRLFEVENYKLNVALFSKYLLLYKDYRIKISSYTNHINELTKNYKPRELADSTAKNHPIYYKCMDIANEMCCNVEYYRVSHSFFKLIIAQNKKYMIAYNFYKRDTK